MKEKLVKQYMTVFRKLGGFKGVPYMYRDSTSHLFKLIDMQKKKQPKDLKKAVQ